MKSEKKLTNYEYAAALRALALLLEQNPDMVQPWEGSENSDLLFMTHDRDEFAATVAAFGTGAKDVNDNCLVFIPEFPLRIKVFGFKSAICEPVTVTRMVPETVVPARPAIPEQPEHVIPAHEETVTEYVCAPFLAHAEAQ